MAEGTFGAADRRTLKLEYYDAATMLFHWVTVIFVLALMGTSLVWNYWTPRDRFWRPLMESTHVSLGILFAILIVARIVWRLTGGRRVPAELGLAGILSRVMYGALYVLLAIEVVSGFVLRWVQGEDFGFFGLFSMPALIAPNRAWVGTTETLHNWAAWAIIILALGHSAAALVHHYVLKDQVLRRMLSWRRARSPV